MEQTLNQIIAKTLELYNYTINISRPLEIDEFYMLKDIWCYENKLGLDTELSSFLSYVVTNIGVVFNRPRYYTINSEKVPISLGTPLVSINLVEKTSISETSKCLGFLEKTPNYVAIIEL